VRVAAHADARLLPTHSFNSLCLVTNCITFVLYIYSEYSFWRRETFIIGHLDERRDKPYDKLRSELEAFARAQQTADRRIDVRQPSSTRAARADAARTPQAGRGARQRRAI
jgi:hypothetical protein